MSAFEILVLLLGGWVGVALGSIAVDLDTIVKMYKGEEEEK